MDNDNKINKNPEKIHQEVMLFLGDELDTIHKKSNGQTYDIEKEYAKTRKNFSIGPTLILVFCFIAVIGIAVIMNKVISRHNQEITVSLQEFEELNLKGLLDTVSTAQANYDAAVKNKIAIETDMETKLKSAKESYDNEIFVIDSMHLKFKKVYNDKVAVAKQKYNDDVKAIHNEYDPKISAINKEVNEYKSQLADFDAAKIQAAREQEKALDSERQVREIEKKKIIDSYEERIQDLNKKMENLQSRHTEELRSAASNISLQFRQEMQSLDPEISDEEINSLITEINANALNDFDVTELVSDVSFESEYVAGIIRDYQKLYDKYQTLDNIVASVPLKNTIPKIEKATRTLVNDMGRTFVETTVSLYEENQNLYNQIDSISKDYDEEREFLKNDIKVQQNYYEAALENLLVIAKSNAVLLYAESYDRMDVYVSPKARYLITEDGVDAEIKASKTIKGKIIKDKEENYKFVVGTDKNGNLYDVNFEELESGAPIKIISK